MLKGTFLSLFLKSKTVKFEANYTDWDIAVDSVVTNFAVARSAADLTDFRVSEIVTQKKDCK